MDLQELNNNLNNIHYMFIEQQGNRNPRRKFKEKATYNQKHLIIKNSFPQKTGNTSKRQTDTTIGSSQEKYHRRPISTTQEVNCNIKTPVF